MEMESFIKKFAEQFEEVNTAELNARTKYRDIKGWSSLIAFSIIAMVEEEYNVKLKGDDIRNCSTIEELYNFVKSQM